MVGTFDEIVDIITRMTISDKEHLIDIINKRIIEEKRKVFHKNYLESKGEKLTFSSDLNKLKRSLR